MKIRDDAEKIVRLIAANNDASLQITVNVLRKRFQDRIDALDDRKKFVYMLARFVKSYYFLTCFLPTLNISASLPFLLNISDRS